MFFQHYLAARSDQEVLPSHVFQSFRAWWDSVHPERDVLSELSILQQFGPCVSVVMEPARLYPSEPALSRTLARLRALDTHTAYPLLLWMLAQAKDQIPPHERDAMLTHLESFRAALDRGQLNKKLQQALFPNPARAPKKEPPTADDLQRLLLNISGENAWPDNKTFHAAVPSRPRLPSPRLARRSNGVRHHPRAHDDHKTRRRRDPRRAHRRARHAPGPLG